MAVREATEGTSPDGDEGEAHDCLRAADADVDVVFIGGGRFPLLLLAPLAEGICVPGLPPPCRAADF